MTNSNSNINTIIINLDKKTKEKKQNLLKKEPLPLPSVGDNRFTTVLQQTPQLNRDYLNLGEKLDRIYSSRENKKYAVNDNFDVPLNDTNLVRQGNPRTFYTDTGISDSIRPTPNSVVQEDVENVENVEDVEDVEDKVEDPNLNEESELERPFSRSRGIILEDSKYFKALKKSLERKNLTQLIKENRDYINIKQDKPYYKKNELIDEIVANQLVGKSYNNSDKKVRVFGNKYI